MIENKMLWLGDRVKILKEKGEVESFGK